MTTMPTYCGEPIEQAVRQLKRQLRRERRAAFRAGLAVIWCELLQAVGLYIGRSLLDMERYHNALDRRGQARYAAEHTGQNLWRAERTLARHRDGHVCDDFCRIAHCHYGDLAGESDIGDRDQDAITYFGGGDFDATSEIG